MKLIDILKEIKVIPGYNNNGILPKQYVPFIDELTESFGEGTSGFDLHTPMSEAYHSEYYENEEDEKATMEAFAKQFNGKTLVSNDTNFTTDLHIKKAPGAPADSFDVAIDIEIGPGNEYDEDAEITVYAPYIDENGEYFVGWFDIKGNYHPDTAHFDEDGNYLG
jgi:hypothetical protein